MTKLQRMCCCEWDLNYGIYLLIEPQPTAASQNRKTSRPFASNSNMSISSYHPNNSCNSVCCLMIVSNDETNVWHRRLGHPSTKILSQVLKTCGSTYQYGKSHVLPFPSSKTKTIAPLKLIHLDIWRASPANSTVGYRCYIHFLDDYTRYTRIYPLKFKSEVFSVFKQFKVLIE